MDVLKVKQPWQSSPGLSFDIRQGCDLMDPDTQRDVSNLLGTAAPELLVALSPVSLLGWLGSLEQVFSDPY